MNKEKLTIDHLASDIRQLAYEMNNVAITVSALIEVLDLNKEQLKEKAKEIYESALSESSESSEEEEAPQEEEEKVLDLGGPGPSEHPKGAMIFGGN